MGGVAAGLGQSLGMGPVRSEEQVVGAQLVHQGLDVVFVERADPDVALEGDDRVLFERLRHLLVDRRWRCSRKGRTQLAPFSMRAIRRSGNRESMPWQVIAAQVSSMARLPMREHAEGVELEGQHLRRPRPVTLVPGVPAVRRVHGDEDVGLHHLPPERVELGIGERARAREAAVPGPDG